MKTKNDDEKLHHNYLKRARIEWVLEDITRLKHEQRELLDLAREGWQGQQANSFHLELEESAEQEFNALKNASQKIKEELEEEKQKLTRAQQEGLKLDGEN
ncbi:hypothetical protein ACYRFS_07035 [Listeria kieliensis]